jgi:hypothetical protein
MSEIDIAAVDPPCLRAKLVYSRAPMPDYEREEWYGIYAQAMVELERAKMAGRIGAARSEITARIEKLRDIPGLHGPESQAIKDALNNLHVLEREDDRVKADERRRAEAALEQRRIIEPKLKSDWMSGCFILLSQKHLIELRNQLAHFRSKLSFESRVSGFFKLGNYLI